MLMHIRELGEVLTWTLLSHSRSSLTGLVYLQEADSDAEEDLTVTHKKHRRFFGVRWKYLKVFLAVMWCLCFVGAGIALRRKARTVVSFSHGAAFVNQSVSQQCTLIK